ncbi:MAG: YceI family protein [Bdellovibrionota bacterium]
MTKILSFIVSLLIFSGHTVYAASAEEAFHFDGKQGKVSFLAIGRPSAIKIRGEGAGASGDLKEKSGVYSGALEFDLNSLQTGINMRDEHMKKKYLNTDQYPKATLKITAFSAAKEKELLPFTGELTLRGVPHTVSGKASVTKGPAPHSLTVNAQFPLKLGDYKIDIPKYMGITVAEDVEVTVESITGGKQ